MKRLWPIAALSLIGTVGMVTSHAAVDTQVSRVPLRASVEGMGGWVRWNQSTAAVEILIDGIRYDIPVGKSDLVLEGDKFPMNAPAVAENGVTYVSSEVINVLRNTKELATLKLPESVQSKSLIVAGTTMDDGKPFNATPDLNVFVPINGDKEGYLAVNNEGRPGGMAVLRIKQNADGFYSVLSSHAVDFSSVGGTWNNCAGEATPWGTVLSGEEYPPVTAAEVSAANLSGAPEDYGFIVEVNPATGSVKKQYAMGRFSHEGATVLPDQKTVFMGDDFRGGAVFKFVADKAGDLSEGQLYAYQRETRSWLAVPRDRATLNDVRRWATEHGATLFDRPEEIEYNPVDGMLYMSETGDNKQPGDRKYGRLWKLNPETAEMTLFIQGGPERNFYQPDNIQVDKQGNLWVHEDKYEMFLAPTPGQSRNALWKVTLDGKMTRFMDVPLGSEVTGGFFTPDGQTFFVNVQHPAQPNKATVLQLRNFNH